MSEREYGVWVFNPYIDARPTVTPAGNRHWAERRTAAQNDGRTIAKVVYRYSFMPDMPWEDA